MTASDKYDFTVGEVQAILLYFSSMHLYYQQLSDSYHSMAEASSAMTNIFKHLAERQIKEETLEIPHAPHD